MLAETLTAREDSAVTKGFGIALRKEETSRNAGIGRLLRPAGIWVAWNRGNGGSGKSLPEVLTLERRSREGAGTTFSSRVNLSRSREAYFERDAARLAPVRKSTIR